MTDLTSMTADESRRILDGYLEAVFTDHESGVAERIHTGAPELPDDPSADQVAAWVELVELLRDPDYIASSRRMAECAQTEGTPDGSHDAVAAIAEQAGAAVRAGVAPDSADALAMIERVEALTPRGCGDRLKLAERLETFTDRRVFRYWTLVGIVNDWPDPPVTEEAVDAWEWYAKALRAHA